MEYEIKDPLARLLGIRVERVKDNGIVTGLEIRPDFRNPYFLTHGGCLYTLGHITAALTAQICLGRQIVVVDANNQYISPLMESPAVAESEIVRSGRELIVCRVRISDGNGKLCMSQTVLMKEVDFPPAAELTAVPTLFPAGADAPLDPVTGVAYPRISPIFGEVLHMFVVGRGETGMIYGADLYPETCNLFGAAHGGMIYTCCDAAASGSAAFLMDRKTVTVSSNIRYLRSIRTGPLRAEGRLVRSGKSTMFYDVDVTDGEGVLSAVAQVVVQCVDYKVSDTVPAEYRRNAFAE